MAAKKVSDSTPNMIETFKEFKENKNIDRMTLVSCDQIRCTWTGTYKMNHIYSPLYVLY